jgi:hypothetical protein
MNDNWDYTTAERHAVLFEADGVKILPVNTETVVYKKNKLLHSSKLP